MRYKVFIVKDAEEDIFEIYHYISIQDSASNASKIFTELERTCDSLRDMPERGHIPPELDRIGVYDFREIHCKPYRIIYRITEKKVFIYCILDSRRNISELLEKRLFR